MSYAMHWIRRKSTPYPLLDVWLYVPMSMRNIKISGATKKNAEIIEGPVEKTGAVGAI